MPSPTWRLISKASDDMALATATLEELTAALEFARLAGLALTSVRFSNNSDRELRQDLMTARARLEHALRGQAARCSSK